MSINSNSKLKNHMILCSIGSAIEYYDFIIFALLASYIGENFFVNTSSHLQLLETFMVFALGYIVRPFTFNVFNVNFYFLYWNIT